MDYIELKAPAKINLFLKILGTREDGYHDIFSWFQAVSLFDYLTFRKEPNSGFDLKHNGPPHLPSDDRNLIVKTAQVMFDKYGLAGGLKIDLQKNIPLEAGLAGGSSDSAATIYAINRLYDLNLTPPEMVKIGLEIGSDVPFFFSAGQAEVTGRGEIIKKIDLPLDYFFILVKPDFSISTAASYAALKMDLTSSDMDIKLFCYKDFKGLVAGILEMDNDFEREHLISFPVLAKIKNALIAAGARLARMSGSGPTMFGLFEYMPEGDGLQKIIQGDWHYYIVQPITLPAWER